jgi:DNA polymerase III subunit epsilon
VAEHMAHAMFAGRREFVRTADGRWTLASASATQVHSVAERAAGEYLSGRTSPRYLDRGSGAARSDRLTDLSYAVVDVETTGGRAFYGDRITEIAAVVVKGGEIVEVFETLVNPERPIPPFITQLTNITWDMVKDAPTFERITPEVLRVLEGNVFVAHNATFDWRFVASEVSRSAGKRIVGRRVCTVRVARKILPQLSRRSLDHVARYYGVEIVGRHRAGGDAIATAKCFIRMMRDLCDRGYETWDDLDALLRRPTSRRKKRRPPALPTSVIRDTTA